MTHVWKLAILSTCLLMVRVVTAAVPADTIDEAEAKRRGITVEQVQIEYLKKDNTALRTKLTVLQADEASLKAKLDAATAQIDALKKGLPSSATAGTATVKPLLHPLLDQPHALSTLYARLAKSGAASVGFISNPLRVGSSGQVESVAIDRIVDKTNMVASIRFPELKSVEMAPGGDYSNMRPGQIAAIPKAWQTGDANVWIENIDTTNLIDKQIIYLNEPLKVTGTKQVDGVTMYVVGPK